jgi:SAM-dependent methyltransferase
MVFRRGRIVEPEYLDHESPGRAEASLRDLVRINRLLGGHRVLREALEEVAPDRTEARTLLDVGAASGDAARIVAETRPRIRVTSLDYRAHHVHPAPGERILADAFRLPFRPRSFDFVYCGLFLHHFSNEQVMELLQSFGRVARRQVIVNDLERHVLPYYFLPATRPVFRWDPITLHDGPVSVQAAFTGSELAGLAQRAGLRNVQVRRYRPAFRLRLIAAPAGEEGRRAEGEG